MPAALFYGQFGVDIFFILSGYILTAVYADMTAPEITRFWLNRVARIFPLHLAILAARGGSRADPAPAPE